MNKSQIKELENRIEAFTSLARSMPHEVLAREYANLKLLSEWQAKWLDSYQQFLHEAMDVFDTSIQSSGQISDKDKQLARTLIELTKIVEEAGRSGFELAAHKASERGRKSVMARHEKDKFPEKKAAIREIWMTGKYKSKALCAEEEYLGLGMSHDVARKALQNLPSQKEIKARQIGALPSKN